MAGPLFVNVAVRDLPRAMKFWKALGFSFNEKFTDATAACLVLGTENYAMLIAETRFRTFTPKAIADPWKTTETILALGVESRKTAEALCRKAFASGGREYKPPKDHGFMFEWGFEDPDGHLWEPFWMDPKAAATGPPQPVSKKSKSGLARATRRRMLRPRRARPSGPGN